MADETCPNCGEALPRKARVCPGCGADERTGWSEDAVRDRLGIADPDAFDHGEFVRREFGEGRGGPGGRNRAWVWVVAALLLLLWLARWLF